VPGGASVSGNVRATDIGWHLPLRFFGPRGTIRTISAQSLLVGEEPDLKGQLVLIGATATGVGDRFSTPYDPVLPGVEVMATGIANLLQGTHLIRDKTVRKTDAAAALVLVTAGCLALFLLPLVTGAMLFLGLLGGWIAVTAIFFSQSYWLSVALPIAVSLPPLAGFALVRHLFDRREAKAHEKARKALGRFQAPALADSIAEDPSFLQSPRAQNAAVLFVDLAGFTAVSETLGPVATRDLLKEFHALVVDQCSCHEGVVLDFMGDGAMVAFGVPDPSQMDSARALQASFALNSKIKTWMENLPQAAKLQGVRIGAHCGQIVLSRLGHDQQQQIAASGDCVNVASRLLEIAREHGASIAVSSQLLSEARTAAPALPAPDKTKVVGIRGRSQDMSVAMWVNPA